MRGVLRIFYSTVCNWFLVISLCLGSGIASARLPREQPEKPKANTASAFAVILMDLSKDPAVPLCSLRLSQNREVVPPSVTPIEFKGKTDADLLPACQGAQLEVLKHSALESSQKNQYAGLPLVFAGVCVGAFFVGMVAGSSTEDFATGALAPAAGTGVTSGAAAYLASMGPAGVGIGATAGACSLLGSTLAVNVKEQRIKKANQPSYNIMGPIRAYIQKERENAGRRNRSQYNDIRVRN